MKNWKSDGLLDEADEQSEDGNISKALMLYHKALKLNPSNYDAWYNMAVTLEEDISFEQALEDSYEALKL